MTQWLTKSTSSQGTLPAYNSYYTEHQQETSGDQATGHYTKGFHITA